jgi:hypothetical protein
MGDVQDTFTKYTGIDAVVSGYETMYKGFRDAGEGVGGYFKTPDVPEAITPDPDVQAGEEGIRKGATTRIARKDSLRRLKYSRTSSAEDSTLGSLRQRLG